MATIDRSVLVDLFRSLDGVHWNQRNNWDTDAQLSTWHGIKVNHKGRVVQLLLRGNNLEGTISLLSFAICSPSLRIRA